MHTLSPCFAITMLSDSQARGSPRKHRSLSTTHCQPCSLTRRSESGSATWPGLQKPKVTAKDTAWRTLAEAG